LLQKELECAVKNTILSRVFFVLVRLFLFEGISPIMTGEEITNAEDYLAMATYLTQVYDSFRCEIPHIKHPKLVSFPFVRYARLCGVVTVACAPQTASKPPKTTGPRLLPDRHRRQL
jgi:hypothetical protein